MNDRLRKMNRVLKVQEQMRRAAEWRLVDLQRKSNALKVAQEGILRTLNDDAHLQGLFVEAKAKRLQRLASQASEVEKAEERQRSVVLERSMQVKRAGRLAAQLEDEDRREREKQDLLEILDTLRRQGHASLP